MVYDEVTIPTYIINLKERTERLSHVLQQFEGRSEFDVKVVDASTHRIGAVGLWNSIVKVVKMAKEEEHDVIVICEDDHTFTEYYHRDTFLQNVVDAGVQSCAVLNGGVGKFDYVMPITRNRFWVNSFCSTQFIVVYRSLFDTILAEPFLDSDVADLKISEITSHKMVLYPFISTQKDFGYSDITPIHNEVKGIVQNMFQRASERLGIYQRAYDRYLLSGENVRQG